MMRRIVVLCILGFLAVTASRAGPQEFDHSPWDSVLKKYVTETGRVDYAALKANPLT
jgi:hypothetical protein